jgi:hypothetical protein
VQSFHHILSTVIRHVCDDLNDNAAGVHVKSVRPMMSFRSCPNMLNKQITAAITEISVFFNISITTHGIKIILEAVPMFSEVKNPINHEIMFRRCYTHAVRDEVPTELSSPSVCG